VASDSIVSIASSCVVSNLQSPTIQCQEEAQREECRPLVAINKRVILGEAERVGGREFRDVAVRLVEALFHGTR